MHTFSASAVALKMLAWGARQKQATAQQKHEAEQQAEDTRRVAEMW